MVTFDNYEWTFGYDPHFGIIGVNRDTQERVVKESGRVLGEISKNNAVYYEPEQVTNRL